MCTTDNPGLFYSGVWAEMSYVTPEAKSRSTAERMATTSKVVHIVPSYAPKVAVFATFNLLYLNHHNSPTIENPVADI